MGNIMLWAPVASDFGFQRAHQYHMTKFTMNVETGSIHTRVVDESLNAEFCRVRDECYGSLCLYGYTGILIDPSRGGLGLFEGFAVWDMVAEELVQAVYFPPNFIGQVCDLVDLLGASVQFITVLCKLEPLKALESVHFWTGVIFIEFSSQEPLLIPKRQRQNVNSSQAIDPMMSDDVYICIFTHDTFENESYLFLYDGKSDSGFPLIIKLRFPVRVPYGFHGQWVSGDLLQAHIAFHEQMNSTGFH